jgi:hypothetical protein
VLGRKLASPVFLSPLVSLCTVLLCVSLCVSRAASAPPSTGPADPRVHPSGGMHEETLVGAGRCNDKFDIHGVGVNPHIQPIQYGAYDAVVWPTGPDRDSYLCDKEAQEAIRDCLGQGGRVVSCGGRIAWRMTPDGMVADSIGGEFLAGILGCQYQAEMEVPFDRPYLRLEAADMVYVFGVPLGVKGGLLDSLIVYRGCPELEDRNYVLTNPSPPSVYTVQPLLHVLNPDAQYDPTDAAVYVERPSDAGPCVFVDFDLCAIVNQKAQYCSGITLSGLPDYAPGYYCGRVELMRLIPEDPPGSHRTALAKEGRIRHR